MVKQCYSRVCNNLLAPGSTVYYCCTHEEKYCPSCSTRVTCKRCGNRPKKQLTFRVCEGCGAQKELLACGCSRITCKYCEISEKRCRWCGLYFREPQFKQSPKKSECGVCSKPLASCTCKPKSYPSPIKTPEKQQCSKCYQKDQIDNLFCNLCGHFYCKSCIGKIERCVEKTCLQRDIDKSMVSSFLGVQQICILCEKTLPNDGSQRFGNEKNVCGTCKKFIIDDVEPEKQKINPQEAKSEPLQSKDNLKKEEVKEKSPQKSPQKNQENKENTSAKKTSKGQLMEVQKQKDDIVTNGLRNNIRLPHNSHQQPQNPQPTPIGTVTLFKQLSPQLPSNPPNLSTPTKPSPSPTQNPSPTNPPIPSRCVLCTIPYPSNRLLATKCSNKHMMCSYCSLLCRNGKCQVCTKKQQQMLDNYFCYKEITTNEDKVSYAERLQKEGSGFCWGCHVVVDGKKIIEEKGKGYCRACLLKLK